MTSTVKRITLGLGAGLIALGVSAGVYASAQNTNQDPRPFSGPGQGRRGPGGRGGPMGPGGPGGPGGPMGMLPMLGPRVGLTDAQQNQIKSIADSHRDEWKALADRARTAHEGLNEAVTADAMDEGLIRQRAAEAGAVEADIAVARARVKGEVFQILTDEQKTQIKAMQTQMKTRMKGRQQAMRERLRQRFGI